MENLPLELISKILDYISIRKLIELRVISKKFKEIIDCKNPKKLILISNYIFNQKPRLYYNYSNSINLILINDEQFLFSDKLSIFKKIKKFKLFLEFSVPINFYNYFEELIELQCYHYFRNQNDFNINLKKLKKFKCKGYNRFILNTPSLTELKIESFTYVDIKYPNQILKIKICEILLESGLYQLFRLINLEKFVGVNIETFFNHNFFKRLINLKEFKLFIIHTADQFDGYNVHMIKNLTYRRKDLQIIIHGLPIDQYNNMFDGYASDFLIKTLVQNQNSKLINPFKLNYVEYDKLMNLFNYQLPIDFHNKIIQIRRIELSEIYFSSSSIEDELKFINFIKKSNAVSLRIMEYLSRSFYKQLADENLTICELDISKIEFLDEELADYFIKMNLTQLKINNSPISFKFIARSFDKNMNDYVIFMRNLPTDEWIKTIQIKFYSDKQELSISLKNRFIKLCLKNKFEILKYLNFIENNFTKKDNTLDVLKLKFFIEDLNYKNKMDSIMIKKLFKNETFYISKQILENRNED